MIVVKRLLGCLWRYLRGTRAMAAMEYAIVVGVVVVGVGAAVVAFQEQIQDLIEDVTADIGEDGMRDTIEQAQDDN